MHGWGMSGEEGRHLRRGQVWSHVGDSRRTPGTGWAGSSEGAESVMQEGRDGVSKSQELCLSSLVLILQIRDSERVGVRERVGRGKGSVSRSDLQFGKDYSDFRTSLVAQTIKNLPAMQETWVWSLGQTQEDLLEKWMATHSNILVWRIPQREAWWVAFHGVTKSQTRLSDFHLFRLKDSEVVLGTREDPWWELGLEK